MNTWDSTITQVIEVGTKALKKWGVGTMGADRQTEEDAFIWN